MKKMTANDWQLYSSMGGSNLAAHVLSKLLEKQIAKAQAKITEGYDALKQAVIVRERLYYTMNKFRKFGARDTEPEGVLVETIEQELRLQPYSLSR